MRLENVRKTRYVILFAVITASFFLIHIVQALTAEPGSEQNPIVAQDYVDGKVSELTSKINDLTQKSTNTDASIGDLSSKLNELTRQVANSQKLQAQKYEIVDMKAGQQLTAGESSEIILRQGRALAVGSVMGGLADVTLGGDIRTDEEIQSNHLLIVPKDDGRGLKALTDIKIMLKGTYTVK